MFQQTENKKSNQVICIVLFGANTNNRLMFHFIIPVRARGMYLFLHLDDKALYILYTYNIIGDQAVLSYLESETNETESSALS